MTVEYSLNHELKPGLNPFYLPTKTVVAGHQIDNPILFGTVNLPKGWDTSNRRSVSLLLWGLWQTHTRQSSGFAQYLEQFLVDHGTAVVTFDALGLSDPEIGGKSNGDQTNYHVHQIMSDAVTVLKTLAQHPQLTNTDSQPIRYHLAGISLGGLVTLRMLTSSQELSQLEVDSVIAVSPLANLSTAWDHYFEAGSKDPKHNRILKLDPNNPQDKGMIERGFLFKYVGGNRIIIPVTKDVLYDSQEGEMDRLQKVSFDRTSRVCVIGSNADGLSAMDVVSRRIGPLRPDDQVFKYLEGDHNLELPDGSNLWEQTAILARDFINPNLRIRYK